MKSSLTLRQRSSSATHSNTPIPLHPPPNTTFLPTDESGFGLWVERQCPAECLLGGGDIVPFVFTFAQADPCVQTAWILLNAGPICRDGLIHAIIELFTLGQRQAEFVPPNTGLKRIVVVLPGDLKPMLNHRSRGAEMVRVHVNHRSQKVSQRISRTAFSCAFAMPGSELDVVLRQIELRQTSIEM